MAVGDEENDYMAMTSSNFKPDPSYETDVQRATREEPEHSKRSVKSTKAEKAAEAEAHMKSILETRIDSKSTGARLLAKMGYTGGALGVGGNKGRDDPVEIGKYRGRVGMGMEEERKRKAAVEHAEEEAAADTARKKFKASQEEFIRNNRAKQELKRATGQWYGAMRVLEQLLEQEDDSVANNENFPESQSLIRPLLKGREDEHLERRRKAHRGTNLPTTRVYTHGSGYDASLFEKKAESEEDRPPEDLDIAKEKLLTVVQELRKRFRYCFWCGYAYDDEAMEGCPGELESQHDEGDQSQLDAGKPDLDAIDDY